MRYLTRITYYMAVAAIGVCSLAIPYAPIAEVVSGAAIVFLPFALGYWLLNNVLLRKFFGGGSYGDSATTVAMLTMALAILLILIGVLKSSIFFSQFGTAFLFFAGEIYVNRKEESKSKVY